MAPRRPGLQAWLQQPAQVRVQPLQKDLCPPGMGVSQALALWSTAAVPAAPSAARKGGVQGLVCTATAWQCATAWEEPLLEHHVELHPRFLIPQ